MPFRYPVALELKGRRCVVIGGGEVAEQKVRALLDSEASVVVVADKFDEALEDLGRAGSVELVRRTYQNGDLTGAFLAISAPEHRSENAAVFKEAEERNVLINSVDDIEHCHFAAPSIVRRGDFILTIGTGGKAPALAKKLRKELTEQFGPEYAELVDLLGKVREKALPARTSSFDEWADRWGKVMENDLIGLVRSGRLDEAKKLVLGEIFETTKGVHGEAGAESQQERTTYSLGASIHVGQTPEAAAGPGRVSIVGAGPGDPGLFTVRGRELVGAADVVVCDRLVHSSLVEGKKVIYAGKKAGAGAVPQAEINELLIRLAQEGKKVVRLKGGDPFVFGRGGEEIAALAEAGIEFEVVPAPTSAIAAVAAAGIPVTDRRFSSSVAIVTGHTGDPDDTNQSPDFAKIATAVDTIVILMGLGNLANITDELIEGGRDPETPAAIIENGTLPSQRVITGDLGGLAEAAANANIQSPAVVVVGDVVTLRGTA
ncbi:MAG: siroheme synthase CysG [Actinomycetota bacterium]